MVLTISSLQTINASIHRENVCCCLHHQCHYSSNSYLFNTGVGKLFEVEGRMTSDELAAGWTGKQVNFVLFSPNFPEICPNVTGLVTERVTCKGASQHQQCAKEYKNVDYQCASKSHSASKQLLTFWCIWQEHTGRI